MSDVATEIWNLWLDLTLQAGNSGSLSHQVELLMNLISYTRVIFF